MHVLYVQERNKKAGHVIENVSCEFSLLIFFSFLFFSHLELTYNAYFLYNILKRANKKENTKKIKEKKKNSYSGIILYTT